MKLNSRILVGSLAVVGLIAAGCAAQSKSLRRASVVEYLYPQKAEPVEVPGPAVMSVPIRVGIAFVPETHKSSDPNPWAAWPASIDTPFTEKEKITLMDEISREFKQFNYIKSVELIPTQYLRAGGGFDNLDQIRTMFGADVIVLLSYDQLQFTSENVWSVTYWTVVGAYVVPGEHNDTATMIDAAVYHIPSRKLLFRAPGVSRVKGSATPVNQGAQLYHDSKEGFDGAATNLVANLQIELADFKTKIKEQPDEYKIEAKPGFDLTAMGKVDEPTVLAVIVLGGALLCSRRRLM